jgi:hypothetical protein
MLGGSCSESGPEADIVPGWTGDDLAAWITRLFYARELSDLGGSCCFTSLSAFFDQSP